MPFFSFSIKDQSYQFNSQKITPNTIYFSKNTKLWKDFRSKKSKFNLHFVKFENRIKANINTKKILFCLPPSLGLGDIIEYGKAINSIIVNNKYEKVGVAFAGKYSFILKKYFNCKFLYDHFITKKDIEKYESVFHFTLEINKLKKQKYKRCNITHEICNYFKVDENINNNKKFNKKFNKIDKLSIFPVSNSVIRSMPINLLRQLVLYFKDNYNIEVFVDQNSEISNYFKNNLKIKCKYVDPKNLDILISKIQNIQYGIFMDSGPLHVAKLFNKKGIFIETSVSNNILLKNYKNIHPIKNTYKSNWCDAPCGLTDIFSFNKKNGCFDTLCVKKREILDLKSFHALQRGNVKKSNLFYLLNPVGCVNKINIKRIVSQINKDLL